MIPQTSIRNYLKARAAPRERCYQPYPKPEPLPPPKRTRLQPHLGGESREILYNLDRL